MDAVSMNLIIAMVNDPSRLIKNNKTCVKLNTEHQIVQFPDINYDVKRLVRTVTSLHCMQLIL